MPKVPEGDYLLVFYDKYGTAIKGKNRVMTSLSEGIELGNEEKHNDENINSFTIDRRIINSLDRKFMWSPKDEIPSD